jgi:hypothetical protein
MFKTNNEFFQFKFGKINSTVADSDRISYISRKINILKSKRVPLASHSN